MPNTPEDLYHRLDELGENWANLDADYRALDAATKNILAECMRKRNEPTSTAREEAARCLPEFKEHLVAVSEARRAANIASINYDNFKTYVDLLRTKAANRRAEMNLR